jgi:hypothetical protein
MKAKGSHGPNDQHNTPDDQSKPNWNPQTMFEYETVPAKESKNQDAGE